MKHLAQLRKSRINWNLTVTFGKNPYTQTRFRAQGG